MSIMDPQFPKPRRVRETMAKASPSTGKEWRRFLAFLVAVVGPIVGRKAGMSFQESTLVFGGAATYIYSERDVHPPLEAEASPVSVRPSPKAGRPPTVGGGG